MEHRLIHSVTHGVPLENLLDRAVLLGLRLDGACPLYVPKHLLSEGSIVRHY